MEEGIEMALDSMRRARASDEVRELIEARRRAEHELATRLEQATEEGRAAGRDAALQETARRLIAAGVDPATVVDTTGLPPEVVESLGASSRDEA